jgi:carbamoyltransferase
VFALGISAFYHDSAAALVHDGHIVAAVQEERFTRRKGDAAFPAESVAYCLDEAGITLNDLACVTFYEKPLLTFDRLLETYLAFAPRGFASFAKAIPIWIKEKILQQGLLLKGLNSIGRGKIDESKLLFDFHHHSHAASAFYPSPFDEAAILVMDGVGEWATTSIGRGRGNDVELLKEIRFPHSLGMLYSAFTYYLGFKVNDGEYKVMGLAPYGKPAYAQTIRENLIDIRPDGSFRLNMEYFNYCTGLTMTNRRFDKLFGEPPRHASASLTQRDMDLAASVQLVVEDAILNLARAAHRKTGLNKLCLAGGVALNCVANGRVLREGPFDDIWIQPASGDAGGALGAALAASHTLDKAADRAPRSRDIMSGAFLGPAYDEARIEGDLQRYGAKYQRLADDALFSEVAGALADEQIVGWFQGRLEYGPRSLGNRSILGDPRSARMQRVLNLKIKYRESFRPFAPAVLRNHVSDYFELDADSPYMLIVAPVRPERRRPLSDAERRLEGIDLLQVARSDIPAVTHVDYSARIQTVDAETNPRFHRLLEAFHRKTGCPVLVNTSFNIRDEPIVCTPEDAYRCFMGSEMDMLVVGNFVLRKSEQ